RRHSFGLRNIINAPNSIISPPSLLARGLRNALGLKHLIRIRPHAGELPLPHRLAYSAIDAHRPATLLRIFHRHAQAPETLDLARPGLPVLHRPQPLVIGAAGEYVAHLQRRDLRRPSDDLANRVLHVLGVVVLAQLVVLPERHTEFLWVRYFVTRHDPRPHQ